MRFPFKLREDCEFDAVGFGLNAVDHLIVVPAYPEFDTKTRLLTHQQSAGGQTASAMVALRRLGMRTAYAGRFGRSCKTGKDRAEHKHNQSDRRNKARDNHHHELATAGRADVIRQRWTEAGVKWHRTHMNTK